MKLHWIYNSHKINEDKKNNNNLTKKLNQLINKNDNFSVINCSYLILGKFLEFDLDTSGDIGKFNVEFVNIGN